MVITASKILNETKTISKEVGTRDISTGLKKIQDFYDIVIEDENIVKDFVRENFFQNQTITTLKTLQSQEKKNAISDFKNNFGIYISPFFEKLESDLEVTQKLILFFYDSNLKILKDSEVKSFKSLGGYKNYCLINPVLDIDFDNQNNCFAKLLKKVGDDITKDIIDLFLKMSQNITTSYIGNKVGDKTEVLKSFDRSIRLRLLTLLKAVLLTSSSVSRKVYFNLSQNKLLIVDSNQRVPGTEEQKDDIVLLVDIKNEGVAQRVYSKAIRTGDVEELFSTIGKRIINGIKTKLKNLEKNKLTLKQVEKNVVPLEMLTDEQIINSNLKSYRTVELLKLSKYVKDKKQISRLIEIVSTEIRDNQNKKTLKEVTKEIAGVQFSSGFLSLKNQTKKMMEDSSEIRKFIENDLFYKSIEEYFSDNNFKIKEWIDDFEKLTGIDTTSIFKSFKNNLSITLEAAKFIQERSYFGYFKIKEDDDIVVDDYFHKDNDTNKVSVYLKGLRFDLSTSNISNRNLIKIIGEEKFLKFAELQKQYFLKKKFYVTPDKNGVIKEHYLKYDINYQEHRNIMLEILELVLLWSSDGMNKSVYYSINNNQFKTELSDDEDSILLTQLSNSEKYQIEFLKAVYSKNNKRFFEYLESRILSSLKIRTQNILKNKLTLKKVLKGNVPLSLLSDNQILDSFRLENLRVSDLETISKLTKDNNQFNRMIELLERFVEDI